MLSLKISCPQRQGKTYAPLPPCTSSTRVLVPVGGKELSPGADVLLHRGIALAGSDAGALS